MNKLNTYNEVPASISKAVCEPVTYRVQDSLDMLIDQQTKLREMLTYLVERLQPVSVDRLVECTGIPSCIDRGSSLLHSKVCLAIDSVKDMQVIVDSCISRLDV